MSYQTLLTKNKSKIRKMNKAMQVSKFIEDVCSQFRNQPPTKHLSDYIQQHPVSPKDLVQIYNNYLVQLKLNYSKFREVIVTLMICLLKKSTALVDCCFQQLIQLAKGKILLVGVQDQQLIIWGIYSYLMGLLDILCPFLINLGLNGKFLDFFDELNSEDDKLYGIGINVQVIMLGKLKKFLCQDSYNELINILLSDIIKSPEKQQIIKYITYNRNIIKFQHLAILRQDQNTSDVYDLLLKNGRLQKVMCNKKMDDWVLSAHNSFKPKQIPMHILNTGNLQQIYQLMLKVQIYASSPNIEIIDDYINNDQVFLHQFVKFLMGQRIAQSDYQFGAGKLKNMLINLWIQTQNINNSYKNTMLQEVKKIFQ